MVSSGQQALHFPVGCFLEMSRFKKQYVTGNGQAGGCVFSGRLRDGYCRRLTCMEEFESTLKLSPDDIGSLSSSDLEHSLIASGARVGLLCWVVAPLSNLARKVDRRLSCRFIPLDKKRYSYTVLDRTVLCRIPYRSQLVFDLPGGKWAGNPNSTFHLTPASPGILRANRSTAPGRSVQATDVGAELVTRRSRQVASGMQISGLVSLGEPLS